MGNISEQDLQNKRELSRIDVRIPFKIRLVPPEERQHIQILTTEATPSPVQLPQDVEDPHLAAWLNLIHAKIDRIIGLLAANQEGIDAPSFMTENISGKGLGFISPRKYESGDLLEVKMFFPSAAMGAIHLYGEVVQSEKNDAGYFTALQFTCIDDQIREKIIKFVFEKERELLRERRRS